MKGFVFEFICTEDRRLSIVHSVILQLKGCCIVHSHILACHELSRIENLNERISSGSYGNPPCESRSKALGKECIKVEPRKQSRKAKAGHSHSRNAFQYSYMSSFGYNFPRKQERKTSGNKCR